MKNVRFFLFNRLLLAALLLLSSCAHNRLSLNFPTLGSSRSISSDGTGEDCMQLLAEVVELPQTVVEPKKKNFLLNAIGEYTSKKRQEKIRSFRDHFGRYNPIIRKFGERVIEPDSMKGKVFKNLERFIYFKQVADRSTLFKSYAPKVDYEDFILWLKATKKSGNFDYPDHIKTVSQLYYYYRPLYEAYAKENKVSFFSRLKYKFKTDDLPKKYKEFMRLGREDAVSEHDRVISLRLRDFENYQDFEEHLMGAISNFRFLEPNFQHLNFVRWMNDNMVLKEDVMKAHLDMRLGDFIAKQYGNFAPYSKPGELENLSFPAKLKHHLTNVLEGEKELIKRCKGNPLCYGKQLKESFTDLLNTPKKVGKFFNCMKNNPVVTRVVATDLIINFSMVSMMYLNNKDSLERFPWEYMSSGIIFIPVMGELNCRASFRTNLPPGKAIGSLENISKGKFKKFNKKLASIMGMSFLGTLTFAGSIYFFDHLYGALGMPIEKPVNLTDQLKMVPFFFLYGGVYNNIQNLLFVNPLRFKLIPNLAAQLQAKTGILGTAMLFHTGTDIGFKMGWDYIKTYEFLMLYKARVMPYLMSLVGIELSTTAEESKVEKGETKVEKDGNIETHTTIYENGIQTKVVIENSNLNGKEHFQIIDMDMHMPDKIINELVDQMPDELKKGETLQTTESEN